MIVLNGKYNHARIMIDRVDEATQSQIINFLNHPAFAKSPIVIMSDCHCGKGAVIGFTMPLRDHVIPNIVGVDLNCGVYTYNLGQINVEFKEFDYFLKEHIPSGHNVRTADTTLIKMIDKELISNTEEVCSRIGEDLGRALWSLGTLGGGNHYIELDKDQSENIWLSIHSGSRHFGLAIATFHQRKAKELMIKTFQGASAYNGLEYLPMDLGGKEYLADTRVAQQFAHTNRTLMAKVLIEEYFKIKLDSIESIQSVHNYIGDDNIIRKGAISAREGERVIIPLNMRDGAIIGVGKGSSKWNYSAPHGAGRNFSRTKAKEKFTLKEFEEEMKGIWSSCVKVKTLDESPMAYKDASDILANIDETVTVQEIIKPVYNFKAS